MHMLSKPPEIARRVEGLGFTGAKVENKLEKFSILPPQCYFSVISPHPFSGVPSFYPKLPRMGAFYPLPPA
jgi:hypothetical protein